MIRKTLMMSGVAGALLLAAPAFAQDAPPPAPQPGEAQPPQNLTLQPGTIVRGADGMELGRLEGVRANAAGEQELTVRGADGQLRGVPLGGLTQTGDAVSVALTGDEFQASPPLAEPEPASPDAATPPTLPPETPPTDPVDPPAGD